MVDGTERPALNSNGKPIHWSEEGIRNFLEVVWRLSVVDYNGRPTLFYHGSQDDFSKYIAKVDLTGQSSSWTRRSSGYRSTQYAVIYATIY